MSHRMPPAEREFRLKEKRRMNHEKCKADPVCLEKKRQSMRDNYNRLRQGFLDMYGRKCACCGENIEEFLVLDHIEGQHGQRKEPATTAYRKALEYYQPKKYRTLCQNCNSSYGLRGYCPHQRKANTEVVEQPAYVIGIEDGKEFLVIPPVIYV